MEFASEMVVKASLNKLKITEIPTTLDKDGRSRPPHLRTWRDGWRHLTFLLMYSPRWLFFYPGMLIFLLGTAGMVWLLPSAQTIGDVTFGVHTLLLSGFAMILGFNVLQFSVLSKHSSVVHGLLPANPRMQAAQKFFSLERLLVIGLFIALLGVLGIWHSLRFWQANHFGNLDFETVMRMVVPSAVALVIGVQIVFGAFLADIIGLPTKR